MIAVSISFLMLGYLSECPKASEFEDALNQFAVGVSNPSAEGLGSRLIPDDQSDEFKSQLLQAIDVFDAAEKEEKILAPRVPSDGIEVALKNLRSEKFLNAFQQPESPVDILSLNRIAFYRPRAGFAPRITEVWRDGHEQLGLLDHRSRSGTDENIHLYDSEGKLDTQLQFVNTRYQGAQISHDADHKLRVDCYEQGIRRLSLFSGPAYFASAFSDRQRQLTLARLDAPSVIVEVFASDGSLLLKIIEIPRVEDLRLLTNFRAIQLTDFSRLSDIDQAILFEKGNDDHLVSKLLATPPKEAVITDSLLRLPISRYAHPRTTWAYISSGFSWHNGFFNDLSYGAHLIVQKPETKMPPLPVLSAPIFP